MADNSDTMVGSDTPVPADSAPTPKQESDVNEQLFGGNQPGQYKQDRVEKAQPVDPANYALDSAQKRYREAKAREDEADRQLQSKYQEMQATIARNQQAIRETEQQRPQLQQVQTVQPTPTQQQNIGNILGNVAAMVAIGTAIFGKRGGGWGAAITQAGVGAFLKNFAEARQEQSSEVFKQWKESQELIWKNNQAKINDYKEVLADRRLDLSEQHQQLAELAYQRQDWKMYHAATQNAQAQVIKIMEQQQKGLDAAKTSNEKAQEKINETLLKKQEAEHAKGEKITEFPVNITPTKAKQFPKDTEFYGTDGKHYKVKVPGQNLQLDIIKDSDNG